MAEHRRVEPRSIMGSGMSTDPERVRDVEEDAERKARLWRERGEQSFGDVLKTAPARASRDDDAGEQDEAKDGEDAAETAEAPASATKTAKEAPPPKQSGPRVPPDPRARALHQLLDTSKRPGSVKSSPSPPKKGPP
jgi:hypothetical protein